MSSLPEPIRAFLADHHVLSLAMHANGTTWAASAFFAHDEQARRFLFLTATETLHGQMLLANADVAGTVAGQPLLISEVCGLQFRGSVRVLEDPDEQQAALDLYYARFPQARGMSAPIWEIRPAQLKLTDNRKGFGNKLLWDNPEGG